jgi:hypothetical protein
MLRLQFYFLMNRVSVLFLFSASILLSAAILYASRFYEGAGPLDAFREADRVEYLVQTAGIAKFILVGTGLFLNIHCFLAGNGRYSAFFVAGRGERLVFILSKLAMIGILIVSMTFHAWLMYRLVGTRLTPYFVQGGAETAAFLWMGAEALVFGLGEALLMQVSDSVFSGIGPLFLFWFLETNAQAEILQASPWIRSVFDIIPHLYRDGTVLRVAGEIPVYLLVLGVLLLANVALFQRRDIK